MGERVERKISVNGFIAWREGAALGDNPFPERTPQWFGWNESYRRAEEYHFGRRSEQ